MRLRTLPPLPAPVSAQSSLASTPAVLARLEQRIAGGPLLGWDQPAVAADPHRPEPVAAQVEELADTAVSLVTESDRIVVTAVHLLAVVDQHLESGLGGDGRR